MFDIERSCVWPNNAQVVQPRVSNRISYLFGARTMIERPTNWLVWITRGRRANNVVGISDAAEDGGNRVFGFGGDGPTRVTHTSTAPELTRRLGSFRIERTVSANRSHSRIRTGHIPNTGE